MAFCISAQFFHPNWDAEVDYDTLILPTNTAITFITTPYDRFLRRESAKIFKLSSSDYSLLKNSLDGGFGEFENASSEILDAAFNRDYPVNILCDINKNRGEYIRGGQSYYEQNSLELLLWDTIETRHELSNRERQFLINWIQSR